MKDIVSLDLENSEGSSSSSSSPSPTASINNNNNDYNYNASTKLIKKKKKARVLVLISFLTLVILIGIFVALYLTLNHRIQQDDKDGGGIPIIIMDPKKKDKQHVAQPTIVVSLDGFRWDYLNRGLTPNLNSLKNKGYYADSMSPQYPSKTFPNHYSMATGLLPKYHGIIGNHMYDSSVQKRFDSYDPFWFTGEPIWVTAEKNGIKTACYYWFGCSAPIKNIQPYYSIQVQIQ